MIPTLLDLSTSQIRALASAARRRALDPPIEPALGSYCPGPLRHSLATELEHAAGKGLSGEPLAMFLETLAEDRERRATTELHADLVWTGPDLPGDHSRDTRIVVHELFRKARKSVLVSTYALYDGRDLFAPLHETWEANPDMTVELFLDIKRGDAGMAAEALIGRFKNEFRNHHWPWDRLPQVHFDPRSLSNNPGARACLHAKCVVVDGSDVFLTSANLTEAAQQRNIEAGVVIHSHALAGKLHDQFHRLTVAGLLQRL